MYPSSNSNANGNEELTGIQKQIRQTTNDSLESTRRMVEIMGETEQIGSNTMIMLDEQGEQLNRIESGLDNIHNEMNQVEKNLTNLQKCCGLCVMPWRRVRSTHRPFGNSSTTISSDTSSSTVKEPTLRMSNDAGMPSSGYITRITNDDHETEMDNNLQLVGSYLGKLKNMGLDMSETIDKQNKQIDRLTDKADAGFDRVDAANKQTKDILRRA